MNRWLKGLLATVLLAVAPLNVGAQQAPLQLPLTSVTPVPMAGSGGVIDQINDAILSVATCNQGTTAPANVFGVPAAWQCWMDTSVAPRQMKIFDGTDWIPALYLDATANTAAANPSPTLDRVGSTRGQILFRGAANWQVLSPGTAGQVLQTGGAGADPSWLAVGGTGTVTSVTPSGTGLTFSSNPLTTTGSIGLTGPKGDVIFRLNGLTDSGNTVELCPYKGNQLTINGTHYTVPEACVQITNAGTSVSTVYYAYAYISGGTTIALELSTTGHSRDATTQVEIKTGDVTRSLVGMARTNSAGIFFDIPEERSVRSWYNDEGITVRAALGSSGTTSSTTYVDSGANQQAAFLVWDLESAHIVSGQSVQNNTAGTTNYCSWWLDTMPGGTSSTNEVAVTIPAINAAASCSGSHLYNGLSEGRHVIGMMHRVSSGTMTMRSGNQWMGKVGRTTSRFHQR